MNGEKGEYVLRLPLEWMVGLLLVPSVVGIYRTPLKQSSNSVHCKVAIAYSKSHFKHRFNYSY